jgi:hypothetical protein
LGIDWTYQWFSSYSQYDYLGQYYYPGGIAIAGAVGGIMIAVLTARRWAAAPARRVLGTAVRWTVLCTAGWFLGWAIRWLGEEVRGMFVAAGAVRSRYAFFATTWLADLCLPGLLAGLVAFVSLPLLHRKALGTARKQAWSTATTGGLGWLVGWPLGGLAGLWLNLQSLHLHLNREEQLAYVGCIGGVVVGLLLGWFLQWVVRKIGER